MDNCHLSLKEKGDLIKKLLENCLDIEGLEQLRPCVNEKDLAHIIQRIYDLNNEQVLKVAALDSIMSWVDGVKNSQRNSRYFDKIQKNFRNGSNKVILAEGDSWFNYPIILSDVIDWIAMEDNLAVYSLASGGDWLLNMLNGRKYVERMSVVNPDIFLISAGGNDLVGRNRVAAIVNPKGNSEELAKSGLAKSLMLKVAKQPIIPLDKNKFEMGAKYLSKDFYALLTFFHLQYYFLMNGIITSGTGDASKGKFPGIRIITQGYDYALPSERKDWGFNPLHWFKPVVRNFLGHGHWLKIPLQMRGIIKPDIQENVIYTMIYLFNEMMIKTGDIFCQMPKVGNKVFHIDSRGSVGRKGWTDELHPLPEHFKNTGQTFIDCINGKPSPHGQVYVVKDLHP
jgi:hypothetical protein